MADELHDDESTGIDGLGQRLLRRSALSGVIRRDLGASIQRRSTGGGGLAAEIWRRWSPAIPLAGVHGSGFPHAGFGAGAVSPAALTPGPSPSRTPGPPGEGSRRCSRSTPPISPLFHQQEAGRKGRDLDVISLPSPGETGVRLGEGPGVRAATSDAPVASAGAQESLGVGNLGPSGLHRSDSGTFPVVRSRGSGTPTATGAGSVGLVQRKAAAAMPSPPSGVETSPAIVRRAANPGLAQPASAVRFRADMERAIHHRRSSSTSAPSSTRLSRVTAPAAAPPLRSEAELGPAITHHSGSPVPMPQTSLQPVPMPLPRISAPAAVPPLRSEAESKPAIAHNPASPAPMPQASLPRVAPGSLPSAPLLLFARPARTGRAEPAVSAALPVAAVSHAAAATRNAQPWQTSFSVASVHPTTTSNLLQAASLPFAHPARVIERDVIAGTSATEPQLGTGMDSALSPPAMLPGSIQDTARPAGSEKLDLDNLAECVMRRLTRSLAVERERHGGRRWL